MKGLFRRRTAYPQKPNVGSKKILILGCGFAGLHTLQRFLRSLNGEENVEITLVNDENYFLFSPLLHEVATGGIETRHIAHPIRRLSCSDRFNFLQASVEKIDLGDRKVTTTAGTLDYDCLVLALGSVTDMSGLHSLESNVFTLKTLHDSMLIRNHIIAAFERASIETDPQRRSQLLTFVVSGGGYTGVQMAADLRDFIFKYLAKYYKMKDVDAIRIILIEAEGKVVGELDSKLGAYVTKHLQRMGIEIRLNSRVTRVWEDRIEINRTEIVPANTLIWVSGVVANPRIAELDAETDSIGRVLVNEYLELPASPGVYALGDCAHFKDPKSGQPIPPRAHTAVRQAKTVARNLLAEIRGSDRKCYHYTNSAEIVSLGRSKAALRFYDMRLYGFLARLIWLVSYSSLATGTYNSVRIITDWLLSRVFGRDTTFLRLKN